MYCKECNKKLSKRNTSGYCQNHNHLSLELKERRKASVDKYNKSDKRKEVNKKYNRTENRRKYMAQWEKEKRKNNMSYRIRCSISANIRNKIKKESSVDTYVNLEEIKTILEKQFDENMSWENYGSYWEIDHIIPQSHFDFTKKKEIIKCWNSKNLRPLTKKENSQKSNSIDYDLINHHKVEFLL